MCWRGCMVRLLVEQRGALLGRLELEILERLTAWQRSPRCPVGETVTGEAGKTNRGVLLGRLWYWRGW